MENESIRAKRIRTLLVVAMLSVAMVPIGSFSTDAGVRFTFGKAKTFHSEIQRIKPIKPKRECIGEFKITAYSYSEGSGENYKTASGRTPQPYYTVAVDPDVIPLGTILYIEGIGEVRADDTGSAVIGEHIDLHIGYDSCDDFGIQYKKVYIEREE